MFNDWFSSKYKGPQDLVSEHPIVRRSTPKPVGRQLAERYYALGGGTLLKLKMGKEGAAHSVWLSMSDGYVPISITRGTAKVLLKRVM